MTEKENKFYRDLGLTIRLARQTAGKNQSEVADYLGITFQQVQKYESGENKIPADRLVALAEYFGLPHTAFLEQKPFRENERFRILMDSIGNKDFQELLYIWSQIRDEKVRTKTLNLLREIAAFSNSGTRAAA